jgi:TetR/AcrR family transcriptional repressor of nem operon
LIDGPAKIWPKSTAAAFISKVLTAMLVYSDVLEDRDLQKFIRTDMTAFGGAFVNRLKSAKDSGELPSDFNAEAVAQIIFTYLQGLYRTALLNYDRPQLEHQVGLFITSLGL